MKRSLLVILFLFILTPTVFAQYGRFFTIEGEMLENEPANAKNLSFIIQPLDFKHLMSNYRLSATGEINYRSPGERIWLGASYSYDYFIHYGKETINTRTTDSKLDNYNLPSSSFKTVVGFNFYAKKLNGKRKVLIGGRFANIKTYAVLPADFYRCFGVHAGLENYKRYIYADYSFNLDPQVNLNNGIYPLNYAKSKVESYANISYVAAGFHYQVIDDLKIRVNYQGRDKVKSNRSVTTYYFDLLFPVSRKFNEATVIVGVDTLYEVVHKKLPVSSLTQLKSMGAKIGVRSNDIGTLGAYAGVDVAFLPGPKGVFTSLMMNATFGFSLNFRAKKVAQR